MRVLVIGCGSIGERHIKNLLDLGVEVMVFDIAVQREEAMRTKYKLKDYAKDREVPPFPDACLICTPASSHLKMVLKNRNCPYIFIEKPIADKVTPELEELVKKLGDRILVGYNWRFHSNIRKVKELLDPGAIGQVYKAHAEFGYYLPYWRPKRDIHDVENLGVILEASHELDYLMWLFGPVESEMCVKAEVGGFGLGVEDQAEIILNFKSGVIASVSLDMLNKRYTRTLQIVGEGGVIDWNWHLGLTLLDGNGWVAPCCNYTGSCKYADIDVSYIEEMKHFIRVVEGKEKPLVTAKEALAVLELAERLKSWPLIVP